jgi:hypothetical protein
LFDLDIVEQPAWCHNPRLLPHCREVLEIPGMRGLSTFQKYIVVGSRHTRTFSVGRTHKPFWRMTSSAAATISGERLQHV